LAEMLVKPTARLTGGPTGPTGDMDSPLRKLLAARRQPSVGAGWRP
jgi:hypothetical protein